MDQYCTIKVYNCRCLIATWQCQISTVIDFCNAVLIFYNLIKFTTRFFCSLSFVKMLHDWRLKTVLTQQSRLALHQVRKPSLQGNCAMFVRQLYVDTAVLLSCKARANMTTRFPIICFKWRPVSMKALEGKPHQSWQLNALLDAGNHNMNFLFESTFNSTVKASLLRPRASRHLLHNAQLENMTNVALTHTKVFKTIIVQKCLIGKVWMIGPPLSPWCCAKNG